MKKESNRKIQDYENKYPDTVPEYYGVFIKKKNREILSVKVDPKRLLKTRLIDEELYRDIQSVKRNTPYFHPKKKKCEKYYYEEYRNQMENLRKLWYREIKPAINKIETPDQVGDRAYSSNIADGIMDVEECEVSRTIAKAIRSRNYQYAIRMFYAQFILLIGAEVEAVMVKVITKKGYQNVKFNRSCLSKYLMETYPNLDYTKLDSYSYYDKIYKLWNFIKHNNSDVFNKVFNSFPELLINPQKKYVAGDIAINYLVLNEDLIMDLLSGLEKFFDEFCSKFFGEKTDYPQWNTESYYVELVKKEIKFNIDPMDIS